MNAKRDFDRLDQINAKAAEATARIMTEPGPKHEPQPSSGTEYWRAWVGVDGPIAAAARRMRAW
ncbi:MAG TPA: hypothetical protein VKE70_18775 [Candidatus Solibacter sp.]|nr:hypothetical protein [Candidatus Solibacter sp.]